MKTLKVFVAMIIGFIAIINGSCKKDDTEPQGTEFLYGDTLNTQTKAMVRIKVYYVSVRLYDTVWPLDANGNPYREIDPQTGKPKFIEVKQTEKTVQQLTIEVLNEAVQLLGQQNTRTYNFFTTHPMEVIRLVFPKKAEILKWKTSNGKIFEEEILELNNVRKRLVDNPTHTLSQELETISYNAEPTWKMACSEYFIDQVQNPSQKISAAKAKIIAAQVNSMDMGKIEIVWQKLVEYHKQGIKPSQKIINELAEELTK